MRNVFSKVALAAAALVGASTSANAYVLLQLADLNPITNVVQTIVSCNTSLAQGVGAGTNCAVADGFLNYSLNANSLIFGGTVGSFDVATTSGIGNQPGTLDFANLNTSSTNVTNNGGDNTVKDRLYINFVGFGFLFPSGEDKTVFGTASYSGTVNAGLGGDINTFFYADGTNTGAAANAQNCVMSVVTNDSCNTGPSLLWSDPAVPAGFSLRTQQFFTINRQTEVNATTSVIARRLPEPVSTSLVGLGLLGLALASRRKAKAA